MSDRRLTGVLACLQEAEYSRGAAIAREDGPAAECWQRKADKYRSDVLGQSLREIRAEAGREGYIAASKLLIGCPDDDHYMLESADQYANQIRSGER